jgi:outer membrane receptor protein involved in Fe transport
VGSGTHGPWGFKGAASFFTQNAWDRPATLPSGQDGDFYPNEGTRQVKFDARVDRQLDGADLSLQGGMSTTSGIMMTGMGPFSIAEGTKFWFLMGDYTRGAATVRAYANIVDGEATNLLNQIFFDVETQAYDFSAHDTSLLDGGDHTLTYGGNLRLQRFDLSIAPAEDSREEGGAFIEDQWRLDDRFLVVGGVRVDGFSVLDGAVLSPRVALLMRPDARAAHTARVSWGRAYRAPSLLENFADTVLFTPLDLSALTGIPGIPPFVFPSAAVGNPDLEEERLDQFEVGYRGELTDRVWLDLAYYWSKRSNVLMFGPSELYTPFDPPPGWPLDPALLALVPLPKTFSFRNIGEIVDQGFEAGVRARLDGHELFVNYSYQAEPDPTTLTLAEINVPPTSRFNAGFTGGHDNFYYGAALTYVGEAVWNDVLDARFHGPTDAFTTLDATFGVILLDGIADLSVRATNLTDADFQQHVVGDIINRRVIGEVGFTLR